MAKKPTKAEQAEADRKEEDTARETREDRDEGQNWNDDNDDDGADDGSDDGDDGEGSAGSGEGTDEDPVRVAIVPAPEGGVAAAGQALTPRQLAGLDPVDRLFDNEQAEDRDHLTNRQTDHERENALDPTSSDPTPGVTPDTPHTSAATGSPPSDMSGRPPLSADDRKSLDLARRALETARSDDGSNPSLPDEKRQGWRTPQQIGVGGGIMARLQSIYPDRIEFEEVPNGHHFPETGRRYRLK